MKTLSSTDIKDLILHPNKYNINYTSTYLELWNKGNSVTTVNDNHVYKTIYDPNPYLYEMPTSAAFSGFTSSNKIGIYNMGWHFYCNYDGTGPTMFMSAMGVRYPDVGYYNYGVYQTSTPSSSTTCINLNFGAEYIYTNNTRDSRYQGQNIWPTLEK